MKFWITRPQLTGRRIVEIEADSKEDAVAIAHRMRLKKIEKLRKRIAELEAMKFGEEP